MEYVRTVLYKLKEVYLFLDINKYEFNIIKIKYLGLIIIIKGLKIDRAKIEAI